MTSEINEPNPMSTEITQPTKPSLFWRIIQFPLVRIILAFVFMVVGTLIVAIPAQILGSLMTSTIGRQPMTNIVNAACLMAIVFSYALYVRLIEQRTVTELSPSGLRDVVTGSLLSAAIFSLIIGVLWLMGVYRVTGSNGWTAMFGALWIGIFPGICEELIFRGVLYRIIEESLGTWIALILTSLFFGFAHFAQPGATLFSEVAIALEAGLMLGMAFTLTRRLWLPIGMHFAWNFVQGGIYGVNVSGTVTPGWLVSTMTGPEWLSGGSFGAEASLVSVVVCFGLFVALWLQTRNRGLMVAPFWRRPCVTTESRCLPTDSISVISTTDPI